jgi:hypothetical protein
MSSCNLRIISLAIAVIAGAGSGVPGSIPSFLNEHLHYSINWPSGLSLGESSLRGSRSKASEKTSGRLNMEFDLDAALPGFPISDKYRSSASEDFCSVEFDKNIVHGKKKAEEKIAFDSEAQTATRQTTGGGKSEVKTSSCGKDALTYLYFVRRELSQGRLPPTQTVIFGAAYQIRLEFKGTQMIKLADNPVEADRLTAFVKGPSSDFSFEVFFLKDAARTPALVRVPFSLGTFSMELIREP